jgi:hypothetical protein
MTNLSCAVKATPVVPEWLKSEVHIQRGTVIGKYSTVTAVLPIAAGGIGTALLAVAHLIAVG